MTTLTSDVPCFLLLVLSNRQARGGRCADAPEREERSPPRLLRHPQGLQGAGEGRTPSPSRHEVLQVSHWF